MRRPRKSRSLGQTLVEFAILLPLFLLIVVVIFDLGRAVYYYTTIYNAAREGARNGIITRNTTQMEAAALQHAYGLNLTSANVATAYYPAPEYYVEVTITYSFVPATPLVSRLLPTGQITLRARSEMETEE